MRPIVCNCVNSLRKDKKGKLENEDEFLNFLRSS